MSSEHYTRCPHCKATFKVNDDQLAAANGQVRCGACMNVFDALAYLIRDDAILGAEDAESEAPSKGHEDYSFDEPEPKQEPDAEDLSEDDFDDELIQDDPDEDDSSEMAIELSDSFMELEKKGSQKASHFGSETSDDEEPEQDDDEAWANKVLEEDDNSEEDMSTTVDGRIEPTFSKPTAKAEPNRTSPAPKKPSKSASLDIPDDLDTPESGAEKIDFYYREPETVRARSFLSKALITLGSIILGMLLLAQVAWFHYEKLAKYPAAKEAFAFACAHIGCQLPELVDLNKIRSHNLVVRSHPTAANALIIDVVLTNEADFPQDFPRLAMYFSDINEKVIAQQVISPRDYLTEEVFQSGIMPSNEPIYVSIELEDPGKEAVNYKIRFFPNKAKESQN